MSLHSDRGSQYCSHEYRDLLDRFGMKVSMSRKGNCFDNAPMESFWGSLKQELIQHRRYRTRQEAIQDITYKLHGLITISYLGNNLDTYLHLGKAVLEDRVVISNKDTEGIRRHLQSTGAVRQRILLRKGGGKYLQQYCEYLIICE